MTDKQLGFNTRAIHVGSSTDNQTGAVQTPIHQTVAYNFSSADDAADLFALRKFGNIYSRLTNPTLSALADRLASLEGGAAAVVTSSGHAAEILTMFALLEPGDNFVMADKLYGGTINIKNNTMPRFGWHSKTAQIDDIDSFERHIDEKTRGIFIETFTNPNGTPVDIEAIATIAQKHKVPLIVDNTLATPYLVRPIEYGANVVIESLTKGLSGHGAIIGGAIIDGGNFDWSDSKFVKLAKPLPDYNNIVLADTFGAIAFTVFNIAVGLRDIGSALSPHSAWLTLLGIETLGLRVEKQVANALKFAQYLSTHDHVSWVSHAGLPQSPHHALLNKISPKGASPLFSFGLKNGLAAGKSLVNNVKLFRHVVQIGDTRSLITHPASTTHSQVPADVRPSVDAGDDVVRVCIGIEDIEDIIHDFEQAVSVAY